MEVADGVLLQGPVSYCITLSWRVFGGAGSDVRRPKQRARALVAQRKNVVVAGRSVSPAYQRAAFPTSSAPSPSTSTTTHMLATRCASMCLGLLGTLQIASIQGLLSVISLCYIGCCGARGQFCAPPLASSALQSL